MYKLVLDLEMCKVPKIYRNKNYKYALETIQIGAVLLDENFNDVDEFVSYVRPVHGLIDNTIKKFTGITSADVKNAKVLEDVLVDMLDWIGNREYEVYAWSESDFLQLYREISCKGINNSKIDKFMYPERWIDYQMVFDDRFGYKKCVALGDALELCDMDPEGRLHDGLQDSINTARLIKKLELNPNFQLIRQLYEDTASIGTSLGDLFSGLNFQTT